MQKCLFYIACQFSSTALCYVRLHLLDLDLSDHRQCINTSVIICLCGIHILCINDNSVICEVEPLSPQRLLVFPPPVYLVYS